MKNQLFDKIDKKPSKFMPKVTTNLRVFLSSPADLIEERQIYKEIIDESNQILSDSDSDIRFELLMWETDTYPTIGKDAQSIINEQIGDDYDIFVGLMWTRFGTPTPRAGSGTEEEFNLAFEKLTKNPANTRILFYFKDSPPESLSKIDLKQLEKINEFRERLKTKGLFWTFDDLEKFKKMSRNHLLKHGRDFRNAWGFSNSSESESKKVEVEDTETFLFPETDNFDRTKEIDRIKIFPSKKVYARLNIDEYSEWRKEFRVRYPIVEGIKSESLLYKINSIFSYEKVFDVSIAESIEGDTWLNDLDYSIQFFKKPFLNLMFYMEGIGAYPWTVTRSVVINYETGNLVKIKNIFNEDSLERLASVVNEFLQHDFKKALLAEKYLGEISLNESNIPNESEKNYSFLEERFSHYKFTIEDLDEFSLSEVGVTFIVHSNFPHVIKNLEPEGLYHFEYSSLKQFIKKDSILEKFLRENSPDIFG
jgi:hypothetical protein